MQFKTCQPAQVSDNHVSLAKVDETLPSADTFHLQSNKNGNGTKLGYMSAQGAPIDMLLHGSLQTSVGQLSNPTSINTSTCRNKCIRQNKK